MEVNFPLFELFSKEKNKRYRCLPFWQTCIFHAEEKKEVCSALMSFFPERWPVDIFVYRHGGAVGNCRWVGKFLTRGGGDKRKVARQGMTSKSPFSFHADCPPFPWLLPFLLLFCLLQGVGSFGTLRRKIFPLPLDIGFFNSTHVNCFFFFYKLFYILIYYI